MGPARTYPMFLTQKKKDFGRDTTNASTYPASEITWLELIRLAMEGGRKEEEEDEEEEEEEEI